MTTINVSNASQLSAALSAAKAGDVILLANGEYGSVSIDKNFTDYVTIKSATPLGATFDKITISNSSYLKLDGVHVDSPSNGNASDTLLGIVSSDHVMVVNSEVNGLVDNVYPIAGYFGIKADNSSYVTIANNDVHDVLNGIVMFGSDHLALTDNFVDRMGSDYFKFSGVDNVLVENNTGGGHTYANPTAHEDFMQFQGSASSNVTIRGNVFLAQNVTDVQGIFVAGDGGHSNILIENNLIYTGMLNAIFVAETSSGVTVRYNTLISSGDGSIAITAPAGATIDHNIYSYRNGEMSGSNVHVQSTNPGGAYYLGNLFPNLTRGDGVSLAEFTPKTGSTATTYGAYDRIADLLSGTSSTGDSTGGGATALPPPPPPPPPPSPDVTDLIYARSGDSEFNGTAASVLKVAHKAAFETNQGTIALTFDADTVAGQHTLISKDATGFIEGGNHFAVSIVNGQLRGWFQDGDSSVRLTYDGIKANVAYDVMATFDNDSVELWLNGKLVDSEQFVMNWEDNQQTLMVGGSGASSSASTDKVTYAFDGTISDVAIWNEALTPAELALLA